MARVYNFSAGPSMLPEKVLKQAHTWRSVNLEYHLFCPIWLSIGTGDAISIRQITGRHVQALGLGS